MVLWELDLAETERISLFVAMPEEAAAEKALVGTLVEDAKVAFYAEGVEDAAL